jgi:hypothetical protein
MGLLDSLKSLFFGGETRRLHTLSGRWMRLARQISRPSPRRQDDATSSSCPSKGDCISCTRRTRTRRLIGHSRSDGYVPGFAAGGVEHRPFACASRSWPGALRPSRSPRSGQIPSILRQAPPQVAVTRPIHVSRSSSPSNSGSRAMLAAIYRASSFVRTLACSASASLSRE